MFTKLACALACALVPSAIAQSFPGFTAGNIVVTRSVYTGDATTVVVGQPLPPVCPATAACGTAKATDNGAYPPSAAPTTFGTTTRSTAASASPRPSFSTSSRPPARWSTRSPCRPNILTTSFSSKSELALNLSTDGTALTFMGYVAPPNTVDVSNSNTPGVYDPTNPAGGSYSAPWLQVGANGAIQVTPTNAYSGNNGRAAILANGLYYMVGNANNGSGTPANVITATGVEIATPGQSAATTRRLKSATSPSLRSTIQPPASPTRPDKAGKDNNFRGLTIFNNTLYVTKGSGSNGIDTVYQVGAAGTLPTLANAASRADHHAARLPHRLAKTAGASIDYPFGIWFANATTLYVADEGDGVARRRGHGSQTAGLQKWILVRRHLAARLRAAERPEPRRQPYTVAELSRRL